MSSPEWLDLGWLALLVVVALVGVAAGFWAGRKAR